MLTDGLYFSLWQTRVEARGLVRREGDRSSLEWSFCFLSQTHLSLARCGSRRCRRRPRGCCLREDYGEITHVRHYYRNHPGACIERFRRRDGQGWLHRCRSGQEFRHVSLRRREDHAGQEACAGRGFRFMHNPLEMFLDGVFAQIHSVGDLLVGESEHEINDDHLFTLGQVIALLDVDVWAFELLLIQLLHDDEEAAVAREGFIGNTEPAKEEPLVGGKTEPFHLDGLAIFGMIAVHQTTDEVADYGMDLFGNETGAVLSGR